MGIALFSDIDRYTLEEADVRLYFHLVLADGSEESIEKMQNVIIVSQDVKFG